MRSSKSIVGHLWLAVLLGGTLGPAVVWADDFGPRVVASRWALAHGRVDEIREKGLATSANPKGESIPGLSALLGKITTQGDPLRISLELNKEGTQAKSGKANEIVLAAAGMPTGMSLVVAETGPGPAKVVWEPMVPRFGNGNLYATVSIPDAGIVAGQELHTAEHFKAYAANSVIYEAPDFGNVVISHALVGGTLNVAARIGGDRLQVHYKRIGYSQPLKLELKEDKQVRNRVGEDGFGRGGVGSGHGAGRSVRSVGRPLDQLELADVSRQGGLGRIYAPLPKPRPQLPLAGDRLPLYQLPNDRLPIWLHCPPVH